MIQFKEDVFVEKINNIDFNTFIKNKNFYDDYWNEKNYMSEYESQYSDIYVLKKKNKENNNIIGIASIYISEEFTDLHNICIRKDLRGRGYRPIFFTIYNRDYKKY